MRTVLFPHQAQASAFRKSHAQERAWSFGATVSSVDAWVGSLWSLWGDGRPIATKTQRMLAFLRILEAAPESGLPATAGMASLLVELADEVLGSVEFDQVLAGRRAVGGNRDTLVEALRRYESLLDRCGLVDAGRACALLAGQDDVGESGAVLLVGFHPSAAQSRLLESYFKEGLSCLDDAPVIERVADDVAVRFAFPSGRYAEPLLLARCIEQRVGEGRVLMTAKDPFVLYESIARPLGDRGISCSVAARRRWACTDFGRAYASVADLVRADGLDRAACADYLLNPASGVSSDAAYAFDASVRRDRLVGKEECLERLRALSRPFEFFEELICSVDADPLLDYFADRARGRCRDAAHESEELDAIRVLRDAMSAARKVGASEHAVAAVLEGATVNVSRMNRAATRCDVHIVGAYGIDAVDEPVWPTVIMCDMDNVSFPVRQADNAAVSFADELGIARGRQALHDLRRAFSQASGRAGKELIIERRLNDEAADPTYPSAAVEEFVDCYRSDPTDSSEIDNRYALPACFLDAVIEKGEEDLYANAAVCDRPQPLCAHAPLAHLDAIESQQARSLIVLPRETKQGVVEAPCFSASQIESYLECPQKWFALRRLRLDELDEGFGAVEMGDFSHGVLDDFYQRFQSECGPKVTPDSLEQARAIMREVISEHAEHQFAMKPSSNRLVPTSVLERREVEDLSGKLMSYLDREAALLPGFSPRHFEFEIPASDAVEYAGHLVMGKIDRIDVDAQGRAVIIDYKSSLSSDYDLYEPKSKGAAMREGKVQALVYAQALRRLMGLDVVGALYVCYGRSPKVSGAIDCCVEPAHVPGLRAETCVYRGDFGQEFSSLLDATEERIAHALDRLVAGCIEARPASASACAYCPEISCPQRRG